MVPQGTGLGRSPDARTRQIRIRNRQQHLHTAMLVRWQAKRRAAFQNRGRAGAEVPDRTVFRCDAPKATVKAANSARNHRPSTSPLVRTPVASAGVPMLPSHGETPPDRSSLGGAGPRAVPASIALAQAEQKHAAKPANIDCNGVPMLVRSSLLALDHANETGDYTMLRDIGAPGFQINTAARLANLCQAAQRRTRPLRCRGDRSTALAAAADRGGRHDADGGLLRLGAVAGEFRADVRVVGRAVAAVRHFGLDRPVCGPPVPPAKQVPSAW